MTLHRAAALALNGIEAMNYFTYDAFRTYRLIAPSNLQHVFNT